MTGKLFALTFQKLWTSLQQAQLIVCKNKSNFQRGGRNQSNWNQRRGWFFPLFLPYSKRIVSNFFSIWKFVMTWKLVKIPKWKRNVKVYWLTNNWEWLMIWKLNTSHVFMNGWFIKLYSIYYLSIMSELYTLTTNFFSHVLTASLHSKTKLIIAWFSVCFQLML